MKLCEPDKCYGCFACINTCPRNCITMTAGENGHIVPQIDNECCVDCGLCAKSCPALAVNKLNIPKYTYAAWNLDKEEQSKSSSGGMSALLAKQMIQEGGIVYGAAFDEQWNVNHVRCENEKDIQRICKSKYVHSWINNIYEQIQQDLKQQKQVMFVGTPCQVAGLKSFLRKDYVNLFLVDLVCHGVPSRELYCEELTEKARVEELQNVSFRGDYGYGYGYGLGFYYKNRLESFSIRQSYYMRGFMDGLFFRQSCYQCPFACKNRIGDITLGDFWGIGKSILFDNPDKNRVSMVLINTVKGEKWYQKIRQSIFSEERSLEEAVNGNPQLKHPITKPRIYNKFRNIYSKSGLRKAAEKVYLKMRIRLLLEKYKVVKTTH